MIVVTKKEAQEALELAREAFVSAATKRAVAERYALSGDHSNYKELFVYYCLLEQWNQSGFYSEGYNNIINKEELLSIVSRINKIK